MTDCFLIAEKYVPEDVLKKVAQAVLRAQDIKEESWNGAKYDKTDEKSSVEAVNEYGLDDVWSSVIFLWIAFKWNDCQEWAEAILAHYNEKDER